MLRSLTSLAVILFLLPAVALAKAPSQRNFPTIRGVLKRADEAIEAARAKAEAEAKDDKMERIRAYEEGKVQPFDAKFVVDILKDDKEEMKYRQAAAFAIRNRFKDIAPNDEKYAKLKRAIGSELIASLNDSSQEIREWVAGVFRTFWPGEYSRFGFDPKESVYAKRSKAWREWRKFLGR